mmetsp:Transcript_35455/g.78662  ORF Transcript_35455/g.78662 Transcript_35455/m.78662 type:complete len:254 (-) Transcript_35455:924-1685(-)|eukprot:CAMPEP_0202893662 /NCGR_PEP_ID=MMETSP1392-20130828/3203_1 /ASSEMBLY_ACC=CAM_ASM_000868 /TAXON_ID=225041 /ORGANISM="Chlamydomonas chlamydogama, Strain SAG 11-48b" /LENGTH=253 /DNA_ID=CAMNT_0049578081 /DNA_START=232 /DNA_END=993 /DNA_ORIENTATION=-
MSMITSKPTVGSIHASAGPRAARVVFRSNRRAAVCHADASSNGKQAEFSKAYEAVSQELDALLAGVSKGEVTTSSPQSVPNELGLVCDENGCVLLDAKKYQQAALDQSVEDNGCPLLKGADWVLGEESDIDDAYEGKQYTAVVGGKDWSVTLTRKELGDFITALKALRETMTRMASQAGPLKAKWDTSTVAMQAFHPGGSDAGQGFDVTFQIATSGGLRSVRGSWKGSVVKDALKVLDAEVEGFAKQVVSAST